MTLTILVNMDHHLEEADLNTEPAWMMREIDLPFLPIIGMTMELAINEGSFILFDVESVFWSEKPARIEIRVHCILEECKPMSADFDSRWTKVAEL